MSRLDPDLVLRSVGRRVAELRSGTQEELAERLGVSIKYLQRIEAGRPNLTIRSLVRIANALEVPVAELFDRPESLESRTGRPPRPR